MNVHLLLACLALCAAFGQQVQPEAVFRSTTKLVQVSVIAHDKDGNHVADLRSEDFQILDNGAPQQIRLFLAENSFASSSKPASSNTFTNQIVSPAGSRNGYSVLLFDNLHTGFEHTARARMRAIQALKAIPTGDKIAIYSLWCRFQVVREFTFDRESLLKQLTSFSPAAGAACAGGGAGQDIISVPRSGSGPEQVAPEIVGAPDRAAAEFDRIGAAMAGQIGDEEMKQLADHLAGIPGRKNLIWIAQQFALPPSTVNRLTNAGVVIYPVDAVGSRIALSVDKEIASAPLRVLAGRTGGVAFYDRDDLDVAIHEAFDDGRMSYTLGFYQPGDEPTATIHQIGIRVSRPGVTLRYRTSYETELPKPASKSPVADLVQALNRPVDATAIPLSASVKRNQDRLDLVATLDGPNLDLTQAEGRWTGKAEVVVRFMSAEGKWVGDLVSQTVTLNIRPNNYASFLQKGLQYRKELRIPSNAVELKLLVGNIASGKVGTLTIALSDIK